MRAKFELDGVERVVNIPYDVREIGFEQFCDMRGVEAQYFAAEDVTEQTALLTESVAYVCGEDVWNLPFAFEGDGLLADRGYRIGFDDELTVVRLYAHVVSLIRHYKPKSLPKYFRLSHKGVEYTVEAESALAVIQAQARTTGEAIEVFEYQRRTTEQIKANPKEFTNLDFTLGLTEFAILVRKEGERLPAKQSERDRFIAERRELFRDVSLGDVLDLRFFLRNGLRKSAKTKTSFSFGKGGRRSRRRKNRSTNSNGNRSRK